MADLKLQVLLSMLDKASAPLRKIDAASKASGDSLRKTRDALRALDQVQKQVGEFKRLKEGSHVTAMRMKDLQQQIRNTAQQMQTGLGPAGELSTKLKKLTDEARRLKGEESEQLAKLQQLRSRLAESGVATGKLGTAEAKLRGDIASTTASLDKQTAALRTQGEQMRKVQALREKLGKTQALAANLSVAGYAGMAGGQRILGAIHPMLDEGKQYQQHLAQMRAQGASASDIAQAERFASSDATRGSSINDKMEILKDANSIFRDMHEAVSVTPQLLKAKYTFDALMAQHGEGEGKGGDTVNQLIDAIRTGELRNATKSPEEFNHLLDMMTRAYVGSGGLVKPSDYLEAMKVGGVATKQMDDKALFFGAMHTIQEMGGMRSGTGFATAYQNWAAGRSTQQAAEAMASLGLVNKNAVQYGKTGHIKKMLPGALVNQQLYESNPFEYLMKEVIPRINPDGKLGENQVVSKLNSLFSGRKGGDLFVGMYMQRENIMKQLAAAEKFASLNDAYKQTGETAQGNEVDLLAKKRDLYLQLGTQVLPLYVTALEKLTGVFARVTAWAKEHPALAKWTAVIGASIGVLAVVAGGAMIALGGLIGQVALLRYAAGRAGLGLFGGRTTSALPAAATAARAGNMLGGAGGFARAGLGRIGMLAMTPLTLPMLGIAAAVAAIAAAALLIWKYWEPIAAFFKGVGKGITEALGPIGKDLAEAFAPLKPLWDIISDALGTLWGWITKLFEPFHATQEQLDGATKNGASFGRVVGAVLAFILKPITAVVKAFVWLGEAIGEAIGFCVVKGGEAMDWFSTHWDGISEAIKAPFVSAFKWVTDKIDWLLDKWQKLKAALGQDDSASNSAPAVKWITGNGDFDAPPPRFSTSAPLQATGTGAVTNHNTYQVNVTAAPGREQDAARVASDELDRRERRKAAQRRSGFADSE